MLIVSDQALRHLGWPRVLEALCDACSTSLGAQAAASLPLLPDAETIRRELGLVAELRRLSDVGADLPFDAVHDIRRAVDACARGAVIVAEDLVAVARTAQTMARVRRTLRHHRGECPSVAALGDDLPEVGLLADELASTFDETGRIRDDASPELAKARRGLASRHIAIKQRLERYLQQPEVRDILQDDYYTQRGERYVLPIETSFQRLLPGIIHGSSNTGQTVYIEPAEFIEANNEIKVAEAAVEAAVRQVLRDRSAWIGAEADALHGGLALLVRLDLLQARARLARRLDAHVPEVAERGRVHLKHARNPLLALEGHPVVANDIALEPEQAFVIVTGPNTGGKTVTLNTLGLCTVMVHSAIPVPVDPDSRVLLFDALFMVQGDAQDIAQHLSTFSGHVLELKRVLADAHAGALVLLDEIAIGTEPVQGAALAIAVLESLADRGSRGLVTTHYERLKALAYDDPRFANASVGLDPRSQEPNFRLSLGEPGASTPFEVASRLGLDAAIVARARAIAGGEQGFAGALTQLRQAREEAEAAGRRCEDERRRLEVERRRLRAETDAEVRRRREEILGDVEDALAALREHVRALQDDGTNDPRTVAATRREAVALKERAEDTMSDQGPPKTPAKPAVSGPHDGGDLDEAALAVGLDVWVRGAGQVGKVLEVRGKGRAIVAVGALKMTVKLREIGRLAGGAPKDKAPRPAPSAASRPAPVHLDDEAPDTPPPRTDRITVDLRGLRRDEVDDTLDRALDHGIYSDEEALWIIHGHGSGAIRDAVRDLVRRSPYVRQWRNGRRHEGGDGVTIVWLHRG
jgi:DNA mismatch repair protein MutS2